MIKYCLIAVILIFGFIWLSCEKKPHHVYLADQIMDQYIVDMTRDKQFRVEMTGRGMNGDIQTFSMGLYTIADPSVEEAREAYVLKVENFLKRVNAWEEIRPYLHNYPATIINFDLHLNFYFPSGRFAAGPTTVAFMFAKYGEIFYFYANDENHLKDLYSESYTTALAIVREQYPELLPN